MKVKKEPVPFDLPNINQYDESTIPPIQFPGHLKEQEDEVQAFRMLESLKKLKINRSLIRSVKRMPNTLWEERVSFEITEPMDDPYINYESVCMIECSRETHEEEIELLLASGTQSSFTKMKEQSCIVDTNEKSEPFIQQLNSLPGISQSSKSSIKMGKKKGKLHRLPGMILTYHVSTQKKTYALLMFLVAFSYTLFQVLTTRGWNLRSPRLVLCGKVVVEMPQCDNCALSSYVSLIRKKFCWGTIFPIGLKRYRDPKEEPIEKEPLMELKEIG
ncbi:hypothetical protein Tco_1155935 [Tanacetum coccineum]